MQCTVVAPLSLSDTRHLEKQMKLLGSLIASSALVAGALVSVPTVAEAAPYPGTVATSCGYAVPGSVKKNRTLFVRVAVRASGNARPAGGVALFVWKINKRGKWSYNRGVAINYRGPDVRRVSLGKFRAKGRYATIASFRTSKNSVYKASYSGFHYFRVTR